MNSAKYKIYTGQSMSGTFCFGDWLILEEIALPEVRPGDVLVYCRGNDNHGEKEWVVHRAVKITESGVMVQGDNNDCPDSTLVTPNNCAGRVSRFIRRGRIIQVRGACRARSMAKLSNGISGVKRIFYKLVRKVGRVPYSWHRRSNFVKIIWRPEIKKIKVMTENGPLFKYVLTNRTVADFWHKKLGNK